MCMHLQSYDAPEAPLLVSVPVVTRSPHRRRRVLIAIPRAQPTRSWSSSSSRGSAGGARGAWGSEAMGSRREDEARAHLAAAEKAAAAAEKGSGGFFRSMLGMGSRGGGDEAAELFVRAANAFKLSKAWRRAGDAFVRAAEVAEEGDGAARYADAAKMYKNDRGGWESAVGAYEKAVALYTDMARFQQCARLSKDMGEVLEGAGEGTRALEAYGAAADFYEGEDAKSSANGMRQKVAMLCGAAGEHARAAGLFEDVARDALESNLLKYGARELLLKAGLCRLCAGDPIAAARSLEEYHGMDPTFSASREGKLLGDLVGAVDKGDVEEFTNVLYDYDSISKLDDWKTKMLVRIKNSIRDVDDDLT